MLSEKNLPNPEKKEQQPLRKPDPKQVEKVAKGAGWAAIRGTNKKP